MGSGKFSLKMCSKSGKFSAEIGVQCGNVSLKMLPVKTDYVYEQIGSPICLNRCKLGIPFLVDKSGKSIVKLEEMSGKTISIGCCFPPEFANSGTLMCNVCNNVMLENKVHSSSSSK